MVFVNNFLDMTYSCYFSISLGIPDMEENHIFPQLRVVAPGCYQLFLGGGRMFCAH